MKRAISLCLLLVLMVLAGGAGGGAAAYFYIRYLASQQVPETKGQGEQLQSMKSFFKGRAAEENPVTIAALGHLKPRGDVIDIAGLMGDRLGSLRVNEGDKVTEGEVLGHLDSFAEAKAQRDAAHAQLEEAKARLRAETAYSQVKIEEAKIAVREAQELDPLDIKAQRDRVSALKSALDFDRSDKARFRSVIAGTIPQQKLEQQDMLLLRDDAELKAAEAMLEKAQSGAALKLQAARAQLLAAEAGLARVKASVQIESLARNLDLAEARWNRTVLKAPRDGCILRILTRPGELNRPHADPENGRHQGHVRRGRGL